MSDEHERRTFSDLADEIHRQEKERARLARQERWLHVAACIAVVLLIGVWMALIYATRHARMWP